MTRLVHGHSRKSTGNTRTYRVWLNMRQRCKNPTHHAWRYYGGRGISIDDRWEQFVNFLSDMGECPGPDFSIDRINNELGYGPQNCAWVTRKEQSRNSRKPKILHYDGKTMNMSEWARHLGISNGALEDRLRRWPLERALGTGKMTYWTRRASP